MALEKTELSMMIGEFRRSFVMIGVFSFIINLLMLAPAMYSMLMSDKVMLSRSVDTLIMISLITIWLFIVMGLLEFIRSRLMIRLGNRLDQKLNPRLHQTMMDYAIKNPGQGTTQAVGDLTAVRMFITNQGLFAFFDAPWIPIYVAILFIFHPALGFFALGAMVISLLVTWINERSTHDLFLASGTDGMKSSMLVMGQLRNVEVMHAMGMRNDMKYSWLNHHLAFLKKQAEASDAGAIWMNVSKVLRMFFQSAIMGVGTYLALTNELTMGMMMAGSLIMGRALAPLDMLVGSWKQFAGARDAYQRLEHLLVDFPADKRFMSLPPPKGELSVEGIVIIPPGSATPSIRGASFVLPAGEVLGVIGPSAAGKSSLARALMGVWPVVGGKVRLDGADISQYNRDELGQYIGYLPQDVELFEGTVAENIARFGLVDSDKVVKAAQLAGVHEMVLALPFGYDTMIGVGGVGLSGGQRQRVALARCMYGDPRFIVLDEPNANLDDAGEKALVQAILAMKASGATVVFITHRMGVLGVTDKILLMVEGQARAYGQRDEILRVLRGQPADSSGVTR
jgi:ATP-binding cassette subfamily C protein EexD